MPNKINAIVRSGCDAANRVAIGPPSEWPSTTTRSEPTASITARASSILTSREGSRSSGTRSDMPTPRLSNTITLANDESRSRNRATKGWSHMRSMWVTQPSTNKTSIGPSPKA